MAADAGKMFLCGLIRAKRKTKSRDAENSRSANAIEDRPEQFGLFALTSGAADTLDSGLPDIIAVHGINGDAFNTWTHGDRGALWLRDFLPSQIPGARVFTFGYNSNVAFTRAKGSLDSHARELLEQLNAVRFGEVRAIETSTSDIRCAFDGWHCSKAGKAYSILGSNPHAEVLQAMVIARLDAVDYGNILECTKGILFLSTPHRGSSTTRWPVLLSNVLNVALTTPKLPASYAGSFRNDLLNSLLKDSDELQAISENFRNQIHSVKIVSFVEQNTTPPFSKRVVDNYTGVLGIPKETIVPMSGCDHHTICKFSKESNSYRLVLAHLKALSVDLRKPASLLDVGEIPPFFRNQGAKSPIEACSNPIQKLGQNKLNLPSGSSGPRQSTLVKDAKYSKLFLGEGSNVSYERMPRLSIVMGLDYGTSYTSVALACADGTLSDVELICDWPGGVGYLVPSQIRYGPFAWCEDPYVWGFLIPPDMARHTQVKRLLDADHIPRELQLISGWKQYELEEGRPPYPKKEPKDIVQDYLTAIRKSVSRKIKYRFGKDLFKYCALDVVITVPALWSGKGKWLAYQAAEGAHFEHGGGEITSITEHEAAATYIVRSRELEFGRSSFEIRIDGTIGDKCGSTLIDQSFRKWMEEKLGREAVERIPAAMLRDGGLIARCFEVIKKGFDGTPRNYYIEIPPAAKDNDPRIGLLDGQLLLT
ncbi:hypothetical protein GP486_004127 [Trichoglossum hirsutum]|uniref:Uncharacterized protein n=1 Tax=Trichoglossum hirsutum TaxID=265104 RepID=A0A9P8LBP4_9PEZI|nr:hypothetical protein GP486_004127 [Trichoglossum hirsutum]